MSEILNLKIMKHERPQLPRQRRTDILADLPSGAQGNIARILKCANATVSAVLNGRAGQDTDLARNIIRLAAQRAEAERTRSQIRRRY
jgi:hypothetical protein